MKGREILKVRMERKNSDFFSEFNNHITALNLNERKCWHKRIDGVEHNFLAGRGVKMFQFCILAIASNTEGVLLALSSELTSGRS